MIAVNRDTLKCMALALRENVGLVHQMPFVCDREGFAAVLEKVNIHQMVHLFWTTDKSRVVSGGRAGLSIEGTVVQSQPIAVSKLRQFRSHHICLCLSEETLKADGHFYLVCMPGEVKGPTQGVNV